MILTLFLLNILIYIILHTNTLANAINYARLFWVKNKRDLQPLVALVKVPICIKFSPQPLHSLYSSFLYI